MSECKCDSCVYSKFIPETMYEPSECYCKQESDNYQTKDGCYMFEERFGDDE